MNILGVGGWELALILLIMLIVAGPKRMARWAYVMGTYVAKFRSMWSETVDVLQKEFDDAGVGIQIPKDIPTRGGINRQASKIVKEFAKPLTETMEKATAEVNDIKKATALTAQAANKTANGVKPAAAKPATNVSRPKGEFGTWSGGSNTDSSANTNNFGSWSGNKDKE